MLSNRVVAILIFCYFWAAAGINDCKWKSTSHLQKQDKQCAANNWLYYLQATNAKDTSDSSRATFMPSTNLVLEGDKSIAKSNPFYARQLINSENNQCKINLTTKTQADVLAKTNETYPSTVTSQGANEGDSKINLTVDVPEAINNCTASKHVFNESKSEDAATSDFANQTDDVKIQATDHRTIEEIPIPVFSEWAQKQMEAAEKLSIGQESIKNSFVKQKILEKKNKPLKSRLKNYASPDCGAKIILSNADSTNTAAVLTSSKDEYMLSPCGNRIWFIVELCEPVQAQKIELANFELFSSSPKNFTIAVSNRFPTRDWQIVGQFIAEDKRNIQKFDLQPQLFGKFVRVDIYSYYSKEHFCPVSLFRVFGTSEFEAFETENHPNEDMDDLDEEFNAEPVNNKNAEQTLFKSASDAVISIVKKAAEALVKTTNNHNDTELAYNNCLCPSTTFYNFTCQKCSAVQRDRVNQILQCKLRLLKEILKVSIFRQHLEQSKMCEKVLLEENTTSEFLADSITLNVDRQNYALNFLSVEYTLALCFLLERENESNSVRRVGSKKLMETKQNQSLQQNETCSNNIITFLHARKFFKSENAFDQHTKNEQQARPATTKNGKNYTQSVNGESNLLKMNANRIIKKPSADNSSQDFNSSDVNIYNNNLVKDDNNSNIFETKLEVKEAIEAPFRSLEKPDSNNANGIGSEVESTESLPSATFSQPAALNANGGTAQLNKNTNNPQTESVFIRLSNRVKALERNMSLSGQYLEELSRRYKKQVEDLQQILNQQAQKVLSIEESNRLLNDNAEYYERHSRELDHALNSLKLQVHACVAVIIFIGSVAILILIVAILFYVSTRHKTNVSCSKPLEPKPSDDAYTIQKSNANAKQKRRASKKLYFRQQNKKICVVCNDEKTTKLKMKKYHDWKLNSTTTLIIKINFKNDKAKNSSLFEKNPQVWFFQHRRKCKSSKSNEIKSIPFTYKLIPMPTKTINKVCARISYGNYAAIILCRLVHRRKNFLDKTLAHVRKKCNALDANVHASNARGIADI